MTQRNLTRRFLLGTAAMLAGSSLLPQGALAAEPLKVAGVYTVPEGHYFFMGDNRDNSADSRLAQRAGGVGFVPFENLIGRADRIMFSSAGRSMLFFWTWRSDRFFEAVR